MLPYLIAGAIGFVVAKIFEEDEAPKYDDGGSLEEGNNNVLEYLFNNTEDITPIKINGRTIGGIDVTTYRGDTETLRVHKMLILPEFQGKGIGSKAINKLFRENPNVKQIIGNATTESKSFWQKIGAEFHSNEHTAFTITRNPDIRFDNGGTTMKAPKLLAPNGKPSNLTSEQYKLVRTKAFISWFGDWQNDPANASKVVDENGEPLVVWRGAKSNNYNYQKKGYNYFAKNKSYAKIFGDIVYPFFLNMRNPLDLEFFNKISAENGLTSYKNQGLFQIGETQLNNQFENETDLLYLQKMQDVYDKFYYLFNNGDGIIGYDIGSYGEEIVFVTKQPNQIKLADGSNTTFDGNNPDIRYAGGGQLKYQNKGAYADVTQINNKEWYLNMIEAEIEGKGYAKKIMNQIIQDAKNKKVEKIILDASLMNKDYFEYGYGFEEISYNDDDGLYRMELNLI